MNRKNGLAFLRTALLFALSMALGILPTGRAAAQNTVAVTGTILPGSNNAYPAAVAGNATYFKFTLDFCALDRAAHFTRNVTPDANGLYSLNIPAGQYNVYLKAAEWLRCVQMLDVRTGSSARLDFVNSASVSINPGDANQDNACDSTDFGILIGAFNSSINLPGSGYDPAADFNYDGSVDSSDFGDLIGDFNNAGETFATNLTIGQKNLRPALTWESIPVGETPCSFNVYRDTAPNSLTPTLIKNIPYALSYPDTDSKLDLTGRTTYYYRVAAVNPVDRRESLLSNAAPFKTKSLLRDIPAPGWVSVVPMNSGGGGGAGPSADDSVNLSSGVYENNPGPDIVVRNPNGPDAMYERAYHTGRAAAGYGSPGLPPGWTDNYDVAIVSDVSGNLSLRYSNGASDMLAGGANNTFAAPQGAPYMVTGTPDLNPMHPSLWLSFALLSSDLSQMIFTPDPNNPNNYLLTEMDNLLGQKIVVVRDPMTNRVKEVDDGNNAKLLTLTMTGATATVTDIPGNRAVQYTFGIDPQSPGTAAELLTVSKIAPIGGPYTAQYTYHYTLQGNWTLMSGVTVPNPGAPNPNPNNVISYDDGGRVLNIVDANGNTRNYAIGDSSATVSIPDSDPTNPTPEMWTENFTGNIETGDTDAQNYSDAVAYGMANLPYLPTGFTNKNGQQSSVIYETHNGAYYGSVKTTTTPITYGSPAVNGVLIMTHTYGYDVSPLGLLTQIDQTAPDASRTLAKISYYPAGQPHSGQVYQIQTPQPGSLGNIGAGTFVTTTYVYTNLGNVLTITAPGPNGNLVAYTFGYTDGGKSEALGEPTHVTDPLMHTTYYTYDGRGNVTSVTEPSIGGAAGYRTDYLYNTADQLVQVTYPHTGQINPVTMQAGTGRAATLYNYYYVGGGLQSVQVCDEGNTSIITRGNRGLVREIDNTPGNEGEIKQVTNAVPTVNSKYDPQYRLKELQDGVNPPTKYHYDKVGNPDAMTYPGGKTLSALFDADHNVKSATNARSQQTTLNLAVGPLSDSSVQGVSYAGLLPNVTYVYDSFGRLTSEDNGTVKQAYTYDDADNLLTKSVHFDNGALDDTLTYTYNKDGSTQSLSTVKIGQTQYTYDDAGRLTLVKYPWVDANNAAQSASYVYDENDRLTKQTTSAVVTTYTYNARSQRLSLDNESVTAISSIIYGGASQTLGNGGHLVAKYSGMKYDGAGNLLGYDAAYQPWAQLPTSFDGHYAYAYDGKDRLASETVTRPNVFNNNRPYYSLTAYAFTHTADEADNLPTLRSQAVNGGYNADNQFNAAAGNYDADGGYFASYYDNINWQYDVEERLVGTAAYPVSYYDDGLRAYWRNGLDYIAQNTSHTSEVYNVYSGGSLLYELHKDLSHPGTQWIYAFGWGASGINQEVYMRGGNFITHYAFDPQGSPVTSYDVSSDWNTLNFYDAFGQSRQSYGLNYNTAPPGNFDLLYNYDTMGFGGQWGYYTDYPSFCANYGAYFGESADPSSGLLLLGHRYYDPALARFLTRDPIGYEGGINLYAYCGNNPIMGIDPDGLDGISVSRLLRASFNFGLGRAKAGANVLIATTLSLNTLGKLVPQRYQEPFDVGAGSSRSEIAGYRECTIETTFGLGFINPGEALAAASSLFSQAELAAITVAKKVPNPGGILGKITTKAQERAIATVLEHRGWSVTNGGGRGAQEWLRPPGGGQTGSARPDITATKVINGLKRTLRINVVTLNKNGTIYNKELKGISTIRRLKPTTHTERFILIPKR